MTSRRRGLKKVFLTLILGGAHRRASAFHYTSAAEKQESEANGILAPGFVLPLGLPPDCFSPPRSTEGLLERFPELKQKRVLLFLSRLDEKKGLELLIPAFKKALEAHSDAVLLIAGSGNPAYVNHLRRLAHDHGVAKNIVWAGFLEGDIKKQAISSATLFVLPSRSENFGIAAAEAMALGAPVIVSDQTALAAEVREHGAGASVPCELAALAEALRRALNNEEWRSQCGKRAVRLALERFSQASMGRELASIYRELGARNGGNSWFAPHGGRSIPAKNSLC